MGALRNNNLYSNIGPIIPIKLSFLGQVNSKIKSKITNYGINNLVIEIFLITEIKERITMPSTSNQKTIKIESPLSIKIVEGEVPEYYNKQNNDAYSIED